MADEDSQPEGLEALLQTLDPERQKILLFMLERDHLAALGAELVGPRAFSPEEADTARPPTLLGWTSPDWGDERLPETVPKDAVVRLASEGLAGLRLPPPGFQEDYREEAEDLLYKDGVLQPFVFFNRSRPASPALPAGDFGPRGEPKAAITVFNEMQKNILSGMSAKEIANFIEHYEKITKWMLKEMPALANLVLYVNKDQKILKIRKN